MQIASAATQRTDKSLTPDSFRSWLGNQVNRTDYIGKFAQLVQIDSKWPVLPLADQNEEYLILRSYVRTNMEEAYSVDKIAAFEKAWDEFQQESHELREVKIIIKNETKNSESV